MVASDSNTYPPLEFAAGNVFLIDRPIRGSVRINKPPSSSSLVRRTTNSNTIRKQELHYLQCRDERDVSVLLPMNQPGEFVSVLTNPFDKDKLSMRVEDNIATQKFLLLVRYVYGGGRPRLTSFSGLLTLLDSFEESSVVGCVLDGSTFTMMEIPMSSPLVFQVALNSKELFSLPVVKHALRVCAGNSAAYLSDMKFKFKFVQKVVQQVRQDEDEDDQIYSATNSARVGRTQTYVYL